MDQAVVIINGFIATTIADGSNHCVLHWLKVKAGNG